MIDEARVKYTISITPEDLPVRGNALASGDPAVDKKAEDQIIKRYNDGDYWAWCIVTVVAELEEFYGYDHLGCASYEDEKDFRKNSGYYEDMRKNALDDLKKHIANAQERLKRTEVISE
jgi:hypothetical protein